MSRFTAAVYFSISVLSAYLELERNDVTYLTRSAWWYWAPVALHAGLIFYLSSLSNPELVLRADDERLAAVARLQDVVSLPLERKPDEVTHDFLVFHEQNRLRAVKRR